MRTPARTTVPRSCPHTPRTGRRRDTGERAQSGPRPDGRPQSTRLPARSSSTLTRVEIRRRSELLEQLALLVGQLLRDGDLDRGIEVAPAAVAGRQPATAQAQPPAAGGPRRHL